MEGEGEELRMREEVMSLSGRWREQACVDREVIASVEVEGVEPRCVPVLVRRVESGDVFQEHSEV